MSFTILLTSNVAPDANSYLASGYDFGYWVKLLTGVSLPTTEETFFDLLRTWFPTVYDIKFLMRTSKVLKGGLQDVADDLGVCEISLHKLYEFLK